MDMEQAVVATRGAGLGETGVPAPASESSAGESPATLVIRLELKPERVEEPQLAMRGVFHFELAVLRPQPVTVELAEPKIAIFLQGDSPPASSGGATAGG